MYPKDYDIYPGYPYDDTPNWRYCAHQWLDTGMRRTYCKRCDIRADWDPMTGEYKVLPPEDDNRNIQKGND